LQDLDEDVEGMQGTIYFLQQELRRSKEERTEKVENGDGDEEDGVKVRTGVRSLYNSDDGSDSEQQPLKKMPRRGSELSLDYNEDDIGLTNGHLKDE